MPENTTERDNEHWSKTLNRPDSGPGPSNASEEEGGSVNLDLQELNVESLEEDAEEEKSGR
jgi:hypothetical protein